MANLNISVFNELNMGAAQDFDNIQPINLSNNFDKVSSSLETVAPSLTLGM